MDGWEWLDVLASKLTGLTGVSQVNPGTQLPGKVMPGTVVITVVNGDLNYSAGGPNIWLHSVRIVYYASPGILPEAYQACYRVIKPIVEALAANVTLDGTVQHIERDARAARLYEGPGTINYGDTPHTGVAFNYEVKELADTSLDVSA